MSGRFRLVGLLRAAGVPERHIRATLRTELGLSDEAIDEAMHSAPEPVERRTAS